MQFGIMPGRGITVAIISVCQLQAKFHVVDKSLCLDFVDLDEAFDGVRRRVIWWTLLKLEVDGWLVVFIQ